MGSSEDTKSACLCICGVTRDIFAGAGAMLICEACFYLHVHEEPPSEAWTPSCPSFGP